MAMRAEHLTPDEQEAIARGEEIESDARRHLAACAPCREAAREGMFATRYIRPLAADHPDEHVLTALWSNALSPERQAEVERHVATCSRCGALFERLVRATPPETSPSRVDRWQLDETRAWAAASAVPRHATLVVGKGKPLEHVQASFLSIAESLRPVELKPTSRRWTWRRPPPEAPALTDGERAFRFKPYREGATVCLAVAYVRAAPLPGTTAVRVTLTSVGGHSQRAEFSPGVEAIFELSPGRSRLVIEVRPRWEIEIRFDA